MDYLIAPTLFQNKICRLPGIGTLTVVTNTAKVDFYDKKISAPIPTIIFSPSQNDDKIFNEFTALSELIKKELKEKGRVNLTGVGDFSKTEEGHINFSPVHLDPRFTPPVEATFVLRQDAKHSLLVGDREISSSGITEYYAEDEKPNDRWWLWAIILAVLGAATLVFYILQNGFNLLGNAAAF